MAFHFLLYNHTAFPLYRIAQDIILTVYNFAIFLPTNITMWFSGGLFVMVPEKKNEIWLGPVTKAPIPTENSTTNTPYRDYELSVQICI